MSINKLHFIKYNTYLKNGENILVNGNQLVLVIYEEYSAG